MWSKAPLLMVRVRCGSKGHRFRIRVVLALYVVTGFLLCWEPFLKLIPGSGGERARAAVEAALAILWTVEGEAPQTYAQVETQKEDEEVLVEVKTL